MTHRIRDFEHFEPATLDDAISLLSRYKERGKIIAGGTDLLVSMKKKEIRPEYIINIKKIPGMDHILYNGDGLRIGALTTHESIASSPLVKDNYSLLATACKKVGTPQIRNMGTIGGNICKGGPSQDTLPPLLVLDAELKLAGPDGERVVPIEEFFIGPFQTALHEAEVLTEIQIPPCPSRSSGCYQWRTKISEVDETLVGVAVLLTVDAAKRICDDIKIGLCSVAPTAIRAKQAEDALRGKEIDDKLVQQAAEIAAEEVKPRSRPFYRRTMTRVLVSRAINEAWKQVT